MANRYALFADSPIGDQLATESGGLVLTTLADALSLERFARSDVAVDAGISYVEFFFYGAGALDSVVGIVQASANVDNTCGVDVGTVGYNLAEGECRVDGVLTMGLPVADKGQVIGLQLDLTSAAAARLLIFIDRVLAHEVALGDLDPWHFAVGLGSVDAGDLRCYVNAGQQAFDASTGISEGWFAADDLPPALRVATEDYLTAADDAPAHVRYEGVVSEHGFLLRRSLHFWPWGNAGGRGQSVGNASLLDGKGALDDLVTGHWRDQAVTVRAIADRSATLASAQLLGRFQLERVEAAGDGAKTLVLRDTLAELDVPLQTGVFYPYLEAVALQPIPVAIGACRSVPAPLVNADGTEYVLSQSPVAAVTDVRDMGDPLIPETDFTVERARRRVVLATPALGKITVDLSTVGAEPVAEVDNVWDGVADPFTGVEGGAIDGWDRGAESGDSPYFAEEYSNDPISDPIDGKPIHLAGVVFPDGDPGSVCWIKLGELAPFTTYRWELSARVGLFDATACMGIATSTDKADLLFAVRGTRFFTGTIVNPTGSAQDVYVLCVRGSAGQDGLLTYAALLELSADGPAPMPESLEGTLRAMFALRRYDAWLASDAYQIDAATGYAGVGYFTQAAGLTVRQAVDAVLASYCACAWQREGLVRIARLVDPADTDPEDYAFALVQGVDFHRDLGVQPDNAPGLTRRAHVQPNWQPLSDADLVSDYTDVPAATRIALKAPGRVRVASGAAVAPRYRHADAAAPRLFLFEQVADGQAELARVLGLYATNRHFYAVRIEGALEDVYPLGAVGTITSPRYGLQAGKALMVVGNDWNPVTGRVDLLLWG